MNRYTSEPLKRDELNFMNPLDEANMRIQALRQKPEDQVLNPLTHAKQSATMPLNNFNYFLGY